MLEELLSRNYNIGDLFTAFAKILVKTYKQIFLAILPVFIIGMIVFSIMISNSDLLYEVVNIEELKYKIKSYDTLALIFELAYIYCAIMLFFVVNETVSINIIKNYLEGKSYNSYFHLLKNAYKHIAKIIMLMVVCFVASGIGIALIILVFNLLLFALADIGAGLFSIIAIPILGIFFLVLLVKMSFLSQAIILNNASIMQSFKYSYSISNQRVRSVMFKIFIFMMLVSSFWNLGMQYISDLFFNCNYFYSIGIGLVISHIFACFPAIYRTILYVNLHYGSTDFLKSQVCVDKAQIEQIS